MQCLEYWGVMSNVVAKLKNVRQIVHWRRLSSTSFVKLKELVSIYWEYIQYINIFPFSTVRTERLNGNCEFADMTYRKLFPHSKARWLSLFSAIPWLIAIFEHYILLVARAPEWERWIRVGMGALKALLRAGNSGCAEYLERVSLHLTWCHKKCKPTYERKILKSSTAVRGKSVHLFPVQNYSLYGFSFCLQLPLLFPNALKVEK